MLLCINRHKLHTNEVFICLDFFQNIVHTMELERKASVREQGGIIANPLLQCEDRMLKMRFITQQHHLNKHMRSAR